MEDSFLDRWLFVGAFFAAMPLAVVVLSAGAMLGEIASRCFGRWRRWVVYPLTVVAILAVTYTLFGVMVALPHYGVIPWWVSGCIGAALVICWFVLVIWAINRR